MTGVTGAAAAGDSGLDPGALLVGFAAAVFLYICWRVVRAWWRGRRMRRRNLVAMAGESAAAKLLAKHGYTVVGAQVRHVYTLLIDGAERAIELRADYLVEKAQRTFVAEVKTGAVATRIETAATRRQMLEYAVAFGTDGVLLVDMQKREIRDVVFPRFGDGQRNDVTDG